MGGTSDHIFMSLNCQERSFTLHVPRDNGLVIRPAEEQLQSCFSTHNLAPRRQHVAVLGEVEASDRSSVTSQ